MRSRVSRKGVLLWLALVYVFLCFFFHPKLTHDRYIIVSVNGRQVPEWTYILRVNNMSRYISAL
jgi:hypothetical protein